MQSVDTCKFGLIEVGTVVLVKKHDQDVSDNWTLLGDDIIDGLRAKIDVSEFTGLHKKTVNHLDRCVRSLAPQDLFSTAPTDLK